MDLTLTLNAGLGSDLGPFTLSSNGSPTTVTPSSATVGDLLAGLSVVTDVSSTEIIVTSTGVCTNSLTLPITA